MENIMTNFFTRENPTEADRTEEGKLVFRYECALGAPLSYTIRPCLLIAVPRVAVPHLADDLGGYSFQKVDVAGRE